METKRILVIGGGAAGYFGAITAAENDPAAQVTIAEAGSRPLQKVLISGGGRCNVTQACFDVRRLIEAYPRGSRELLGPFSRFQPSDTVDWFAGRGVNLKTESDGRMFPVSDSSQTIIDCFEQAGRQARINLRLKTKVTGLRPKADTGIDAVLRHNGQSRTESFDTVLLACGGAKAGYSMAQQIGHTIESCVPSLFTFEVKDRRLDALAGVSVPAADLALALPGKPERSEHGPLLVTHWGVSGPAIIRLSAWGARDLYDSAYRGELKVSWSPTKKRGLFDGLIRAQRQENPRRLVQKHPVIDLPKRLWENLCTAADVGKDLRYADISRVRCQNLESQIFDGRYQIQGKGVFKEEFVTCGGVRLSEVNFRSMESKLVPGLFFAGEVLDIDGITGGYNFQSAWTTGYLAGLSL
jgi:predicted Rossmann fold flavoprotein